MLVIDLLHSCGNERVAAAAVGSIGGAFEARLRCEADERGLSVGALVADMVRTFARGAGERDWRDLSHAVRRQDFPLLAGLQIVVVKVLQRQQGHGGRDDLHPVLPVIASIAMNRDLQCGAM